MAKVGLQLYSIKEISEKDFFGAIRLTAESGYEGIEFAGFFNTPASELKKILNDCGVEPCGSHTGISLLEDDLDGIAEYNLKIDNKYIIVPALPEDMRNSRDSWLRTADNMNMYSEKLKKYNLVLGYHNHAFEFEKYYGMAGYDIFAENTNPDILLEIDTFWVEYSGESALEYTVKYKDRLDLIHIKDMDCNKENTEIGSGNMDFPAITAAAEKTDWFIVEQEAYSMPMEQSIKISCDYLKGILK